MAVAPPTSPDTPGTPRDDSLWGKSGTIHVLQGAKGNDTYYLKTPRNSVVEHWGEGDDTIVTWMSYDLRDAPNVENLTISGMRLSATGNALANRSTTNSTAAAATTCCSAAAG